MMILLLEGCGRQSGWVTTEGVNADNDRLEEITPQAETLRMLYLPPALFREKWKIKWSKLKELAEDTSLLLPPLSSPSENLPLLNPVPTKENR